MRLAAITSGSSSTTSICSIDGGTSSSAMPPPNPTSRSDRASGRATAGSAVSQCVTALRMEESVRGIPASGSPLLRSDHVTR